MFAGLDTLNDRQKEAVLHGKSPLLILAGAGSGKTRVVTTRIAWLIQEMQFRPDQILAVTFTNKAAREMQERVAKLTGLDASMAGHSGLPMVKTFHSFCAWLLRRNAALAGLDPYFSIYDDDDSLALVKSILPSKIPPAEARQFQHWISRCKDDDLTPEDDLVKVSAHPDLPEVFALYEKKLAASGNVDFGGLIQKSVHLLRGNKGFQTRMQQKFQVVLVDEYQDCNGVQFELLKELTGPETWLAVVGDDDQSIYRFRGADVGHILSFQDRFPGTTVIRLEENYRSTGRILAVAGQVVAKNQGRLGKTLWTKNPEGQKPRFVLTEDQDAEAQWALDLIRRSPLTETAILYRTNAQSRAFEAAFVRAKIPYKIVGSVRFFAREEIKDVLAWLAFLNNPRDGVAFGRIINKPTRGLGATALSQIENRLGFANNWLDACGLALADVKGKAKTGLGHFLTLAAEMSKLLEGADQLAPAVNQIIEKSGLAEYHQAQDEVQSTSRRQNLDELVSAAAPFAGSREGLAQFLETIELDASASQETDDEKPGTVTLITMHNTKGLEFDRVLVAGLEDGLFPRDETAHDRDELEEERRLFYVAITRARKELWFSACKRRLLHGRFLDRSPSRFLGEIAPTDVDGLGQVAAAGPGNDGWVPGQRIYHDDYGAGTVVKKWYNAGELALDVRFDSGRMGRFLPAYTPLEKMADD
jgi:DNA helicase-2/ATP-dependent DNA helicase PcrA